MGGPGPDPALPVVGGVGGRRLDPALPGFGLGLNVYKSKKSLFMPLVLFSAASRCICWGLVAEIFVGFLLDAVFLVARIFWVFGCKVLIFNRFLEYFRFVGRFFGSLV